MNSRQQRMTSLLQEIFQPTLIQLTNESHLHAGHRPADEGPETHFHLVLVSEKFIGLSRLDRTRLVNEALKDERDGGKFGGLHALSMKLMTAQEWNQLSK